MNITLKAVPYRGDVMSVWLGKGSFINGISIKDNTAASVPQGRHIHLKREPDGVQSLAVS